MSQAPAQVRKEVLLGASLSKSLKTGVIYTPCVAQVLSRDLTAQLNVAIQFLVECRPLSVPMGNAIKFLKLQATSSSHLPAQSIALPAN